MNDLGAMIIGTVLSSLVFSFLFNFFSYKIGGIFYKIQKDLSNLTDRNRRILSFLGHVLSILITVFLIVVVGIRGFVSGIVLGFLGSIVDTCFGNNIIASTLRKNK